MNFPSALPVRSSCNVPGRKVILCIQIKCKLREYRQQAKANLLPQQGIVLHKQRGPDVEARLVGIKHNISMHRFMLKGLEKVETG